VSVSLSVDGPGDAELISAVRGGDVDAYGDLFARHVDAARRLARQLTGPADADDLVSDAFTKVLLVLQRGGGPDLAFRAYLLTAVRRLHVDKIRAGSRLRPVDDLTPFDPGLPFQDTAVEGFDNAAAARAFASLPERWQMVLWHTEVEQQKPADIAPLLGMSANSVSALAYRAREGLRQAFLSQHATDPDDVDCAWTRDHLGAYVRGGLSRRDATRVDDHLAACHSCAAVYLELTEVNSGLGALLAPLLLGTAGAGYLSSGGAGSSVLSGGLATAKTWATSHASVTAVAGMVVTATAVFSIYGATHFNGHPAADLGSPPSASGPAVASSLPTTGHDDHRDQRGPQARKSNAPVVNIAADPSAATQSTAPPTTPAVSDQSTPPVVDPSSPTSSQPTDPTTAPPEPNAIRFDSNPPTNPAIGMPYAVSASGGSGIITFSVDRSSPQDTCSLSHSGSIVTFDHAGTCVVEASDTGAAKGTQAGSTAVTQTIVVPPNPQSVAFDPDTRDTARVDDSFSVHATSTSGQMVTYSPPVDGAGNASCRVGPTGSVTFQHVGTCTVLATQAGGRDLAESSATERIAVGQGIAVITFASTPPDNVTVNDSYDNVSASSQVGSATITTLSDNCEMDGSSVRFTARGSCVIAADQDETKDYAAAAEVTQTVQVAPAPVVMAVNATSEALNGNGQQRLTVTVDGLPEGEQAQVEITFPGSAHVDALAPGCTPSGNDDNVYDCQVTQADEQTFTFDFTVNKGRQVVHGILTPEGDLVLDPLKSKTTFDLTLSDASGGPAVRSFAPRSQP
jgi:RNA polymerase sigma factor (sigma-70 family)